jgi:hypothetical protein
LFTGQATSQVNLIYLAEGDGVPEESQHVPLWCPQVFRQVVGPLVAWKNSTRSSLVSSSTV